jgi:hypothetical protein
LKPVGVDGVGIDFGVRRQFLQFSGHVEQFVEHEVHVAQRGVVLTHGVLLSFLDSIDRRRANGRFKQTF